MTMGVDIETYSSVELSKTGVRPYTEAPDFAVLLIAYKVDDQPTKLIDLAAGGEGDPPCWRLWRTVPPWGIWRSSWGC